MAVIYKSIQSKMKTESGKQLYHPRVVYTGNVKTDQIAREVAAYSSLSSGDVKNTIDNLVTVVTQHLQASESVTLEGLGTFRLAFRSRGEGFENEADVNSSRATLGVRFTPASTRNQDSTVATRSFVTGTKCVRFDMVESSTDSTSGSGTTDTGGNSGSTDEEYPME
ncbi:MAG: HU family DNA-binding protein [Bacteroides sp.]|nr:HU family DNA-binding protein [Bacteroides sp.]